MAENIVVYTVRVNTENGKVKVDGLTKSFVKAETALKKLKNEAQSTTKDGLNPMIDKTGLAGATVVELGRTISDSNYGIRGMANNLSQLATLMTTLIATTGGLANGFRALWTALMGPLGVIVVFQTVIAVIESFALNNEEAAEETKRLTDTINEEVEALQALVNLGRDYNGDIQKQIDLKRQELRVRNASKALYEFEKETIEERVNLEKQIALETENKLRLENALKTAGGERYQIEASLQLVEKAKINLTNQLNDLNERRNEIERDYLDALRELEQTELERRLNAPKTISFYKEYIKRLQDFQQNTATTSKEFEAAARAILYWESKIAEIGTDKKGGIDKLAAFLEKWKRKRIEAETKTQLELLKVQEDFAIKEAKALGATQEQLIDIIKYYQIKRTEIEVAGLEARFKALALSTKKAREKAIKDSAAELKRTNTAFSEFAAKRTQEIYNEEQNAIRVEEKRQERLDKQIAVAQAVGAAVTGIADNINAAYQKEIDIEQNKTTAINNELRQRLANENLSADERRSIQDKIARNDEALRVKQEAIEKKRFKANKTAAIAEATVNTFLAATGVLKSTEGGSIQRIAGMIAVIGAGLAQVAMISKQQFVSSQSSLSGSGAGTSGTRGGVQAPEFNIVGASSARQLADVVEGQLNRPIKTYVVSSDVSTAQSLERNIVEGASI